MANKISIDNLKINYKLFDSNNNSGTNGQVLTSNGTNITWGDVLSNINATKIADGSVSNTEFQHLNGVTSAIQTQLDSIPTLGIKLYIVFCNSLF